MAEGFTNIARYGCIIIDTNGALFGTLQDNSREVITKFSVDIPKKRSCGGGRSLRFARIRREKRQNYMRKVAETAVQCFITDDTINVIGIVLGTVADFSTEFHRWDIFDPRLQAKILTRVIIDYGGENGYNQAIALASEILGNIKFIQEKKLISRYFDEVCKDSGLFCFGADETLKALEIGAVETLIVWENCDLKRCVLRNSQTQEMKIIHCCIDREKEEFGIEGQDTGVVWEDIEEMPLLEWFMNNYQNFGATLEIVTDKSHEGCQFVHSFDGVGGILRHKIDLQNWSVDKDTKLIDYSDYNCTFFFD